MSKHLINVKLDLPYYPLVFVNEDRLMGWVTPDSITSNKIRLVGDTELWFDIDQQTFYVQSNSYDLFDDCVTGISDTFPIL